MMENSAKPRKRPKPYKTSLRCTEEVERKKGSTYLNRGKWFPHVPWRMTVRAGHQESGGSVRALPISLRSGALSEEAPYGRPPSRRTFATALPQPRKSVFGLDPAAALRGGLVPRS